MIGFSKREGIDTGSRQILLKLHQRDAWGKRKGIARATLHNHFCKNVFTFDYSLDLLIEKGLILVGAGKGKAVSLDVSRKSEIESYL